MLKKYFFLSFNFSGYGVIQNFFPILCKNLNAGHRNHLLTKFQQHSTNSFGKSNRHDLCIIWVRNPKNAYIYLCVNAVNALNEKSLQKAKKYLLLLHLIAVSDEKLDH